MYQRIIAIWTHPEVSNFDFDMSKYFCQKTLIRMSTLDLKIPNLAPCWRYTLISLEWNAQEAREPPYLQSIFISSRYNLETFWLLKFMYLKNWDKIWRSVISKPLFELWIKNFAKCPSYRQKCLIQHNFRVRMHKFTIFQTFPCQDTSCL